MSEYRSKGAELSSSAEMTALVREVADFSAPSPNWKDRVNAAARVLHLPFGRVKAHYYGEARRVDAGEMDRAREAANELREARRLAREREHLAWLECEIARHRASGEELRGPHVDALLGVLRAARGDTGTEGARADE